MVLSVFPRVTIAKHPIRRASKCISIQPGVRKGYDIHMKPNTSNYADRPLGAQNIELEPQVMYHAIQGQLMYIEINFIVKS